MRFTRFCVAFALTTALLHPQSFDCAKATKPAEKMVCASDSLKDLDLQLAQTYKQAIAKLTTQEEKYQLQQNEQLWLKERFNECRTAACLTTAYRERIAELSANGNSHGQGNSTLSYTIQPFHVNSALTLPQVKGSPQDTPAVQKCNALIRSVTNRGAKLYGDYDAAIIRNRYATAYLRIANDTGGAHPAPERYSYVFDLERGEQIKLAGLFQPGANYLPLLSKLARPLLAEKVRRKEANGDPEWIERGSAPTPENFQHFTITDDALVLHLPPYQVGPYSDGDATVTIPASALSSILDPSGPLGKTPSAATR